MKTFWAIAVILVVLAATAFFSYRAGVRSVPPPKDSISVVRDTVRDTIREKAPPPLKITVRDTLLVPVKDTSGKEFLAEIPITEKEYGDDSTYRVQVSGYMPRLDWIEVYPRTVYERTEIYHTAYVPVDNHSRWGVGVSAGYGYMIGENRFTPTVSIGVQYDLFRFKKRKGK